MKFVAPLRDFGREDVSSAGGKGANLGELVRIGLPVPDGFVITTTGYAAALQSIDLRIADRLADNDSASVRADIEATSMPPELRAEITDAYAALRAGPVAVRSSATAEDLPGGSLCRSTGHLPHRHG
jgi:rifampicin phosphotransferase